MFRKMISGAALAALPSTGVVLADTPNSTTPSPAAPAATSQPAPQKAAAKSHKHRKAAKSKIKSSTQKTPTQPATK